MNREEYFKRSLTEGLPKRCPIINQCERHRMTLLLYHGWEPSEKFKNFFPELLNPVVPIQGCSPAKTESADSASWCYVCPEVSLFERDFAPLSFPELAVMDAHWDKYSDPQFSVNSAGHYSECSEYGFSIHNGIKPPEHGVYAVSIGRQLKIFLINHWQFIINTLVAIAAVIASILGFA